MGFVRDLVKAGSGEFVEDAVEHVGVFFVAKKAGAQRFVTDARASNRHFLRLLLGPLLTGEGPLSCRISRSVRRRAKLVCRFHRYQERVSPDARSGYIQLRPIPLRGKFILDQVFYLGQVRFRSIS